MPQQMFFLQFEGTPRGNHPLSDEIGGAFINCWIERPTLEEAEHVARQMIEQEGWIIGRPDEAYPVDRDFYADDPTGLECFEQALIDKTVLLFHEYPVVDAEDQEEDASEDR